MCPQASCLICTCRLNSAAASDLDLHVMNAKHRALRSAMDEFACWELTRYATAWHSRQLACVPHIQNILRRNPTLRIASTMR